MSPWQPKLHSETMLHLMHTVASISLQMWDSACDNATQHHAVHMCTYSAATVMV